MKIGETAKPTDFHIGLVGLAAFFVVWSLRATVFYFIDESIPSDFWRTIYSTLIKAALWVGTAYAYVRWVRRASAVTHLAIAVFPSKGGNGAPPRSRP